MAPRISYIKPAKTTPDLIAHLAAKKLKIPDEAKALHALELIGYYRLLIYMRPLQDIKSKVFYEGVEFDDVLALYDFDRRLRLICLDAVERIEVALRAAITNALAPAPDIGPHFYLDQNHFSSLQKHTKWMSTVNDPRTQKHQPVAHYFLTYDDPPHAPIWAILEAVTFGDTSQLFQGLQIWHRKSIAAAFGIDEKILVNWFRSINTLRNVCAHHSQLWDKNNLVNVPLKAKLLSDEFPKHEDRGRIAARAVTLVELLRIIDPSSDWKKRFKSTILSLPKKVLIKTRSTEKIMGFEPGWAERDFWN